MAPIEASLIGVRLQIHVQPRASRTEVVGLYGDAIKVRVAAPPVQGAANAALVRYLSERLWVSKDSIVIKAGAGARRKLIEIARLTPAEVASRLGLPDESS